MPQFKILEMSLKDWVIIDRKVLENIFLRKKSLSIIGTSLGLWLTLLISYLSTDEYKTVLGLEPKDVESIIFILIILVPFFIIIYSLIIFTNKNSIYTIKRIQEAIINSSISEHTDNTVIILFCKQEGNELKFAVKRNSNWDSSLFCPYIKDIDGDINDNFDSIKEAIIRDFLKGTPIPIDIEYMSDMNKSSDKLTAESIPKRFNYRFILVTSSSPFFPQYVCKLLEDLQYDFMTTKDMLQDEPTIKFNYDIIEHLSTKSTTIMKSLAKSKKSSSKIIWNIDKRCNKGCSICAYGDINSETSSLEEKIRIIDSLSSLHIDEIDISTGDSPDVEELRETIKYLTKETNIKRISLTTTSEVLIGLTFTFIKKHNLNIDITYDTPHQAKDRERKVRSERYSENNYNVVKDLFQNKIKNRVKAHVVLFEDTQPSNIKTIRNNLNKIGIKDILLIRLMPVGRQSIESYPDNLLKKKKYDNIIQGLKSNSNGIRLHCSLRGLLGEKLPCELGINKLGISPDGNIYACPWAEHIKTDENPFFLGNIIEEQTGVADIILKNDNYINILKNINNNQPHCKVFSYLYEGDIFGGKDPLYS